MTTPTTSARPNALDRLRSIYDSPGPYTSLYLSCGEFATADPVATFDGRRESLAAEGASSKALDALAARVRLPVPDDVGGWALHAADDGSTAVDFAPEGPSAPILTVGHLPMAAPLIEWDQWRVPHVTVSFGAHSAEIASWLPGAEPTLTPLPVDPTQAAAAIRILATSEHLRLVVIVDEGGDARGLAERLHGVVPPHTNVVELDPADIDTVDDVVDGTVRYVADVVARDTVRALEDFRFMQAGGRAAEGTKDSFAALASGRAQRLLIHDDPSDPIGASFGTSPIEVAAAFDEYPTVARRADVAIWSAVSQGVDVRIIPSTSSNGPDENIGVVLSDTAARS